MTYIKLTAILLLFFSQNLFGQINPTIDSLKAKLNTEEIDTNKILLYNSISIEYRYLNSDSSIYYLKKGLELAKSTKKDKFKSLFYTWLGGSYYFRGENITSLQYLDSAYIVLQKFPNDTDLGNYQYFKSLVYFSIDDHDKSIEHAYNAIETFTKTNRMHRVSGVYGVLIAIYNHFGDYKEGLKYALKANEITIETNDLLNVSANLNNIAIQYHGLNQLDSAYYFLRQAISLNKNDNNLNGLAINYLNMASYMFDDNELDTAEYYVQKSEKINQRLEYNTGLSNCYELSARIALAKKDTSKAEKYYKKIIDSKYDLGNSNNKILAYSALHDIAVASKQYKEAIDYFKSYKTLEDSLDLLSNQDLLDMLNLKIEQERYENKLELENKEVIFRSQRKTFFLIILSIVVVILALTIFYVLHLQRAKSRAIKAEKKLIEEQLECKNREITSNVMTLIRKNKALNEITSNLKKVEQKAVKVETKKAISKVAEEINKAKNVEVWKEFEIRFNQVHGNFYTSLLRAYPGLSPAEQRLCALLRMNMSTKDISELVGVHPRSVDNSRSKIRKKLGLNPEDNLVSFLSKI